MTHFHADHFLGLPGMLKTFALRGRELPLTLYGPRRLARADHGRSGVVRPPDVRVRGGRAQPGDALPETATC